MLKFSLDYFKFNSDMDKIITKLRKTRYKYVELSDQGAVRFSKQVAFDYLIQLKADYLSGDFEKSVLALSPHYEKWKNDLVGNEPIGVLTGRMASSFQAWRSRMGGDKTKRGYTVGIMENTNSWEAEKLNFLEYGTGDKGGSWKAGPQPGRPIFAMSLNRYVGSNYGRHVAAAANIADIWRV